MARENHSARISVVVILVSGAGFEPAPVFYFPVSAGALPDLYLFDRSWRWQIYSPVINTLAHLHYDLPRV